MVGDNSYGPRVNYRFCHELAHIILGHQSNKVITEAAEKEADRFASELMLPSPDFLQQMSRFDICQLKEHYDHASWEAVARKWAELRPALLTIFDNGRFKYRGGPSAIKYPVKVTSQELTVFNYCSDNHCHYNLEIENLCINGYYIDEGRSFERVLILTEVIDLV